MNHKYTYIPKDIDVEAIASSSPRTKPDEIAFLVGNLLESSNKRRDELQYRGSITMSSQILSKYFRNYSKGLKALVDAGVVSTTGGYYPGKKSKSYNLASEYFTSVKEYEYKEDSFKYKLKKRLNNHKREKQKKFKAHHKHLVTWFDSKYLHFNKDYALELANDLSRHNPELLPAYEMSIHRFASAGENIGSFSIDSTAGRFHSPLTNLKSEFRSAIRYYNPSTKKCERLYSIDIVNCQPYLSQLVLNPILLSSFSNISLISPYINCIMYAKSEQSLTQQGFQQFINDVNSGMFYERFASLVHSKHQHLDFDRKQAKIAIYQTFFSDNRFIGSSTIPKWDATPKTCFKNQYPEVYKVFAAIKRKNSSALARLLQRIESHIMIETVVKRLYEERPECPIYTIHDSVATTMENVQFIEAIVKEEFRSAIGVEPKLDIKQW